MWTNAEIVRKILGLTVEEVSDDDLEYYIEDAQRDVFNQITEYHEHDRLIGSIDGRNTVYKFNYPYLADSDFDGIPDIKVYVWVKDSIAGQALVTTIDLLNNRVTLYAAPSSNASQVTACYYTYPSLIDTNRLPRITGLLAAYYYAMSEFALIPEQWFHGAYRFTFEKQFNRLLDEYYREIQTLIRREHKMGTFGVVEYYPATVVMGSVPSEYYYYVPPT
jgi:hypothetical protein